MLRSSIPTSQEIKELPDKIAELNNVIETVNQGAVIPINKQIYSLKLLAEFECWDLYIQAVRVMTKLMLKDRLIEYHKHVSRIYFNYLENTAKFEEFLIESSRHLQLPFNVFWRFMIHEAMDHKDYKVEAQALEGLVAAENSSVFKEKALERLVLLYEEKLCNDELINKTYKKLLAINPENVKALIYFKNIYTQLHDWEEVESILKTLIKSNDLYIEQNFYIIELASLYLNYLNEDKLAKQFLDKITVEDGYHTCKTKYSLLAVSGEFQSAYDCLTAMLEICDNSIKKAHVYFHMGVTKLNLNQVDHAFSYFYKSLNSQFYPFVAIKVIKIAISYNRTELLDNVLKSISSNSQEVELRKKAQEINYRFYVKH